MGKKSVSRTTTPAMASTYLLTFSRSKANVAYIPRTGIARSGSSSIFGFLRNLHAVFHGGHISLHSHAQCVRVSFSPCLCQCLFFLMVAILTGVRSSLTVVLICISLMLCDIEHLFTSLLATCISSSEKYVFSSTHDALWEFYIFFKYNVCRLRVLNTKNLGDYFHISATWWSPWKIKLNPARHY